MLKQKTHINVFNQKTIAHLISYNTSQLNLRTPWSKLIWQWLQMDKYFLWFGLLKLREISSSWLNTFLFSFVRWFTNYNSCLYFNDDAFVAILLEFVKKGRNIKKNVPWKYRFFEISISRSRQPHFKGTASAWFPSREYSKNSLWRWSVQAGNRIMIAKSEKISKKKWWRFCNFSSPRS